MTADPQPESRVDIDREYGSRIAAVEPGGNERVPDVVVVYWIGPWLGVVLTDQYLRRGGCRSSCSTTAGTPTRPG